MSPLEALLARPPWMRDALCRERPGVNFYPERGESATAAKTVCAQCSVADGCRTFALDTGERFGIWAGLSVSERNRSTTNTKEILT